MDLAIHPYTKVGDVLDAYPAIEDKLIAYVPAFAKLRNPVLRRTVAKIATLEQAAAVGGIPVRDLVLFLREHTGQAGVPDSNGGASLEVFNGPDPQSLEAPDWLRASREGTRIDVDAMLAKGQHPLGEIRKQLSALQPGCFLLLTSGFLPAPMFDIMRASGINVHWRRNEAGLYETMLLPPAGARQE